MLFSELNYKLLFISLYLCSDDEPDGPDDPKHYIIVSGFTDSSLMSYLLDMKVTINAIFNIKTDYHLKLQQINMNTSTDANMEV